ncbi:hypothetical protein FISHEDRAFT_73072 [Fistulina hepatica ATCC 64428]|uniref:Uncharacterized protein n=1 Tax=Fistulina hepatica ATCC 64428 TaxID=1128425 RepID=A0A0D7ADD6_9AGAR|nr:hypothetical protein FISHEDRAFT_73072 [Fistulina hepatica ATCC 64428]
MDMHETSASQGSGDGDAYQLASQGCSHPYQLASQGSGGLYQLASQHSGGLYQLMSQHSGDPFQFPQQDNVGPLLGSGHDQPGEGVGTSDNNFSMSSQAESTDDVAVNCIRFADWLADHYLLAEESHISLLDYTRDMHRLLRVESDVTAIRADFAEIKQLLQGMFAEQKKHDETTKAVHEHVFDVNRQDFTNGTIIKAVKAALEAKKNLNGMESIFDKGNRVLRKEWNVHLSRRVSTIKENIRIIILQMTMVGQLYYGGLAKTVQRYMDAAELTPDQIAPQHIYALLFYCYVGRRHCAKLVGTVGSGPATKRARTDGTDDNVAGSGVEDGSSGDSDTSGSNSALNLTKRKRSASECNSWLTTLTKVFMQKVKDFGTDNMSSDKWLKFLHKRIKSEQLQFPGESLSQVPYELLYLHEPPPPSQYPRLHNMAPTLTSHLPPALLRNLCNTPSRTGARGQSEGASMLTSSDGTSSAGDGSAHTL